MLQHNKIKTSFQGLNISLSQNIHVLKPNELTFLQVRENKLRRCRFIFSFFDINVIAEQVVHVIKVVTSKSDLNSNIYLVSAQQLQKSTYIVSLTASEHCA